MWAALVSLILAAFKWLFGGKQQTEGEAQGKAEQASQESSVAATKQSDIAQAEADTDHSKDGLIAAAKKGEF